MQKDCPRAKCAEGTRKLVVKAATDPAVMLLARRIVAGVDRRYELDPSYKSSVRSEGKEATQEYIRGVVDAQGACDVLQTDPELGGIGLFGGLHFNRRKFVFYEWIDPKQGQMRVSITRQEARDIVSGKKRTVIFRFCSYRYHRRLKKVKEKYRKKYWLLQKICK